MLESDKLNDILRELNVNATQARKPSDFIKRFISLLETNELVTFTNSRRLNQSIKVFTEFNLNSNKRNKFTINEESKTILANTNVIKDAVVFEFNHLYATIMYESIKRNNCSVYVNRQVTYCSDFILNAVDYGEIWLKVFEIKLAGNVPTDIKYSVNYIVNSLYYMLSNGNNNLHTYVSINYNPIEEFFNLSEIKELFDMSIYVNVDMFVISNKIDVAIINDIYVKLYALHKKYSTLRYAKLSEYKLSDFMVAKFARTFKD